jgi:putative N-acetylmannosamine-6-phosphate epimerase
MLSRIPEEYKKDGQIIHMKDMAGNEYIVECQASSTGYIETNIKGYSNKELMTEQMKRISQLMNYKVGDNLNESVKSFRADKNNDFENMFTITRGTK